jgi:DNA/RNA endonuclease YhcR with UshA esterase domain
MNQKRRAVTRMGLAALAASSALFLGACGGGENAPAGHQAGPPKIGAVNPGGGASVSSCVPAEQVLNNPQSYVAKQVTITGTIAQVVSPHAFTVATTGNNNNGGNAQAGRTQSVLAVVKETVPRTPGAPVQITGTLQPTFDSNQAATFTGGNIGQGAFAPFNGKPYVQAEFAGPISANLIRGGQSGGIPSGGNSASSSCAAVSDVLNNTQSYASQQVTITGTIAQIVSPHAITVAPTGNNNGNNAQTLLALDKETMPLTPGSPVQITGTLQPTFDPNQAITFIGSNIDPAAFTPFNGKPYVQAAFAGPASANLTGSQSGS